MCPDSKIVNKYGCGHMKATLMLTGAVAKQISRTWKRSCCWFAATDGSSDGDDKFMTFLVIHVDKDSGLIATFLRDMPNINSGSTAQETYVVCNEEKCFR